MIPSYSFHISPHQTSHMHSCGSGESFLKLYVFFNMLELFERWLRSVGVDLFDLLAASCRQGPVELLPKYLLAPWPRPTGSEAKYGKVPI